MSFLNPFSIILLIFFTSLQAQSRINSKMGTNEVKKTCAHWAKESHRKNISTLIIGFEGLWSLNQRKVDQLQKYQSQLNNGAKPKLSLRGSGGYITKGPMAYLVKNYGQHFAFTVLSHRTEKNNNYSIALTCINEWHKVFKDNLDLHIIGHSFGGYASLYLMHKLNHFNIPISTITTADARAYSRGYKYFYASENVHSFHNFFQKGFLRGYPIEGAQNLQIKGPSHGTIPSHKRVIEAVDRIFSGD